MNLVEPVIVPIELVFKSLVSSDILDKLVFVLPVKIVIPPNIFQQHVPKTFFQPEIGKMEIDEMPT